MARAICRKDGQHSLLLGSSKRVCQLTRDDHIKIAAVLSLSPTEISAVPTITKKCFLINVGHEGVVLSSKDSIIVTFEGSDEVVSVHHFLSVRHEGGNCLLLGEGSVKPFLRVGRKEKKEVKSSSLPNSFDDDCSTCTDEISDPNILLQKS